MKKALPLFLTLTFLCTTFVSAQFSEKKKDYKKYEGFFDFYYDEGNDKIFLEVKDLEKDFLYVSSLSSGIGSNDIGLDRGNWGMNV